MIPHEELWERTGQEQIITEIKRRKWGCIGHTLRKPATNTTRQALSWNPQGKWESGKAKTNLAKECGGRVEGNRN